MRKISARWPRNSRAARTWFSLSGQAGGHPETRFFPAPCLKLGVFGRRNLALFRRNFMFLRGLPGNWSRLFRDSSVTELANIVVEPRHQTVTSYWPPL